VTAVARVPAALSLLERAVIESVAYSDVFDYPLTLEEIRRGLPVGASPVEVMAALEAVRDFVAAGTSHHALVGREALVETRARRAAASRRLMRRAFFYGRLIARLPFVRMVTVTGSLAVDNAEDGDDIDYLIATASGRVWLARALTMGVVRLASLRGLTLCPNYLLAETALELPERDAYTARELLQTRPVAGYAVYSRMLAANAWCAELLPNWQPDASPPDERLGLLKRLGEAVLGGRLGDALERWFLRRKGRELNALAGANGEVVFNEDVCKGHFDAHRARLESELARRLARLGVER
jgi:hypothetical protein